MKRMFSTKALKKLVVLILPILCMPCGIQAFTNRTFYVPRSQGTNIVRDDVGWSTLVNLPAQDDFYGVFAFTPAYTRSFKPQEFINFLLKCPTLTVSGSQYPDRGSQDVLADYWGLPSDFQSILCFDPKINNFILDLNFYFGLDQAVNGLYVRINAPITQTSWDLNMREFVKNQGVNGSPAGYMSAAPISNANLVQNAADFFQGTETFGDMEEPLQYGKIFQRQVENRIAELRGVVGWNWTGNYYHVGFNARASAPTGNRPSGEFLFEPIAGNGKHWEVGVGVTAHYDLWTNEEQTNEIGIYFDANIIHLCGSGQKRSFDFLNNGYGSRYMLIEEMASESANLFLGSPAGPASPDQYRGFLAPAINYTTLDIKTSFDVQADMALTCLFRRQGLNVELGYNFFGRSAEKLHCRTQFPSGQFAAKGDAQLYGFDNTAPSPNPKIIPLAATQHNATLHAGQIPGNSNFRNLNADSAVPAADSTTLLNQLPAATMGITPAVVQTSNIPILLTDADIDTNGALLAGVISNALFFHISHVWYEHDDWSPYLGFGGEVEWANGEAPSTYSQWQIWAKGGVAF